MKTDYRKAIELISAAHTIVVIQAENPDADSLGSALALDGILHAAGKQTSLYCPVDTPRHLRYLKGWDRVSNELPERFDLSIIVDTSAGSLLEKVFTPPGRTRLLKAGCLVIDHHDNENSVPHPEAELVVESSSVATAQVIYEMAALTKWKIDNESATALAAAIMSDSLGFTSGKTTARSLFVMAELVEKYKVDLSKLDMERREWGKKTVEILRYKADLIKRIEFHLENRLAMVTIPLREIEAYSEQYNPAMLALEELRNTEGVDISVVLKDYGGRITGKLRSNYTAICDKIAEHFEGGGHPFAAGFKTRKWRLAELQQEIIKVVGENLR